MAPILTTVPLIMTYSAVADILPFLGYAYFMGIFQNSRFIKGARFIPDLRALIALAQVLSHNKLPPYYRVSYYRVSIKQAGH